LLLGLLLLVAAFLKLQQWHQEPSTGLFSLSALILHAATCGEILLGIWLVSGFQPRFSLMVATVLFGCFAVISLWKIARGITDCGCFGALSLSPKVTCWIDVSAFIAGFWTLNSRLFHSLSGGPLRLSLVLPVALVTAMGFYVAGFMMGDFGSSNAATWIGRSWPPVGAVDFPADLSRGRWVILIYSSNCGHCTSMASDYAQSAGEWQAEGKKTRLALIDSEFGFKPDNSLSPAGVVEGNLVHADFYHHEPILLLLVEGRVKAIKDGWEVADFSHPPYAEWIQ